MTTSSNKKTKSTTGLPVSGYQTQVTGDKPRSKSKRRLPELASIKSVAQRAWFAYEAVREHNKTTAQNYKEDKERLINYLIEAKEERIYVGDTDNFFFKKEGKPKYTYTEETEAMRKALEEREKFERDTGLARKEAGSPFVYPQAA
jgi:histidinol-phosphate/aromatic aminotransferase/cobyric acid decarboxylase-like protein